LVVGRHGRRVDADAIGLTALGAMTMTDGASVNRLQAAGLPVDAARAAAGLVDESANAIRAVGAAPIRWAWFVPGRVEILGKHTDYAGGRSLVAALPRGLAIVAAPRADGVVRVVDARWRETYEWHPSDTAGASGWRRYVATVARRLRTDFPGAEYGIDIALASNLPRAAGLSSSSALVVGLALALMQRAELERRRDWDVAIGTPLDLAGYLGAVENGLPFKTLSGSGGVGTFGGSEDHAAILTCRPDRVSAFAYVPVRSVGDAPMPPDWRFVIATSGVAADKAAGARDRYNRMSLATRAIVEAWRIATGETFRALADVLSASPDAAARVDAVLARAGNVDGFGGDELRVRLTHFVAEDARVPLALDAFRRGDVEALGVMAAASQDDAGTRLGNQIPETMTLAALARQAGAFAASSFGAGFGGSVWALVEAAEADDVSRRWLAAYADAAPHTAGAEWFVARPGPGAVALTDAPSLP
jgi:galactokinase